MPTDRLKVDQIIWANFLASNKEAKARSLYDKAFSIVDVLLSEELTDLRSALMGWVTFASKELASYLLHGDTFSINNGMVERELNRFAEANRLYAEGPEEIERYQLCVDALKGLEYATKVMEVDFNKDVARSFIFNKTFKSPFLVFNGFPKNSYQINHEFIKTGNLTFEKPRHL